VTETIILSNIFLWQIIKTQTYGMMGKDSLSDTSLLQRETAYWNDSMKAGG